MNYMNRPKVVWFTLYRIRVRLDCRRKVRVDSRRRMKMNYRSRVRMDYRTRMRSTYNLQQNEGGSPNQSEGGLLHHSIAGLCITTAEWARITVAKSETEDYWERLCGCELLDQSMCVDYWSEVGMDYDSNLDVNYRRRNESIPFK